MNIRQYIPVKMTELFSGVAIFLVCFIFVFASRISRLTSHSSIHSEKPVNIYLHHKTNLAELSTIFADSGVIRNKQQMRWAGQLLGWNHFSKGHYLIDGSYSYDVLLSRMARGIQDPIEVTILPGQDKGHLIKSIASNFDFDSTQFAKTVTDTSFLESVRVSPKNWMGHMLPNTYSMYWTSSPEMVITRILKEFNSAVTDKFKDRLSKIDMSVDDIVTLASIIEWEVKHDEEKPIVSSLYWNRLKKGMRLQADPTVNYAIGERRRLLYEDYEFDDPYNTYLHKGLPPGPITNPSLSSIEAALFPADTDYLYMVATPEGYHVFSKTFEEHKENSAKWREWLQEQYRIKREQEQEQKADTSK